MPVPSLIDLCTKACVKNVRSKPLPPSLSTDVTLTSTGLVDVGAFEYWQIRTVLQRVENPDQLRQIEQNSPQLLGEDAELWQAFIARDIPNWQSKNYRPRNPKKWYEVYCKYKKEQKEEILRDEEILRNSMMGLQKARDSNVSKIVDLKMLPKMPRDPRMMANNGGVPLKGKALFRKEPASALSWTSGSKTKMTDGKSVLTRARREAKEISQMGKLAKPTHRLALGQVQRAPAGMVKEYRTATQPAIKILSKKNGASTGTGTSGGLSGPSMEERERRLRAAKGSDSSSTGVGAGTKPTMVGSSDEDDFLDDEDEDEDADDLFDESSNIHARPASSSRPSSSRPVQHSSPPAASASRPKARPSDNRTTGHASSPPPKTGVTAPPQPKPMMPARRKAEVDIFNRGAKKRRVG